MEDWFDDVFIVREDKVSLAVAVEKEVPTFLGSTKCAKDRDTILLQWWHNEFIFPRLATLARKYLTNPASSVPSERVFSICGNIITKKRSRMRLFQVDTIVFLKMNGFVLLKSGKLKSGFKYLEIFWYFLSTVYQVISA